MSQYYVVSVSRFDFKDKETGRSIRGCKATFLGEGENSENLKGRPPLMVTGDISLWDRFQNLPGNYELDLGQKQSGSKVTLFLKDAAFVPKQ